jgi:hypothetical protein
MSIFVATLLILSLAIVLTVAYGLVKDVRDGKNQQ